MEDRKEINASVSKAGLKSKLRDAFIPADVSDVGMYLLTDWVIPGVWDFVQGGINSIIPKRGGGSRSTSASVTGKPSAVARIQQNVAYNKRYDQLHGRTVTDIGNYATIKIMDKADAFMVQQEMIDIIGDEEEGQGQVTIGWFLDRCGIKPIPAAAWDWGWRNLDYSRIERFEDGWRIIFPKAVSLR